jgi:hypothetical protein
VLRVVEPAVSDGRLDAAELSEQHAGVSGQRLVRDDIDDDEVVQLSGARPNDSLPLGERQIFASVVRIRQADERTIENNNGVEDRAPPCCR